MSYSVSQLQDLWKQAGGSAIYAPMAAAVAMAESGGNPASTNNNSNGTQDRGLWQINSIHGSQSTFDPLSNARSAVAISKNGTTWRPWCTAWSNGRCGGTYLGSGAPVNKYIGSSTATGSTPSGVVNTVAAVTATPASLLPDVTGGLSDIFSQVRSMAIFFALGLLATICVVAGLIILLMQSRVGNAAVQMGKKAL
jgi:Lysozyme like domain